MNITIIDSIRKELKLKSDGRVTTSMRGVATICGVDPSSISRNLTGENSNSRLAQMLKEKGFVLANLVRRGFPESAVAVCVEYYAFEAGRYCTDLARNHFRAFASIGIRVYLKEMLLGSDERKIGHFVTSKELIDGNYLRIFIYGCDDFSVPVPFLFVNDNWYVHTRSLQRAIFRHVTLSVDYSLECTDEEYDELWCGLQIQKSGNFSLVKKVMTLDRPELVDTFSNWVNALGILKEPKKVEPKVEQPILEEPIEEVKITEVEVESQPSLSNSDLTMVHHFAMQLINNVQKHTFLNSDKGDLNVSVLETAFDMLKWINRTAS
jgi:hypothetical protein